MLGPSNGPRAIEFRVFSSACFALPCTECTQGSPGPSVDRFKPKTAFYGMPGVCTFYVKLSEVGDVLELSCERI